MTKIKTARTAEGEKFYYLGHTQAVVDDNGNNIEDLLAEQEEKIELLNDNTGVSDYPEFSTSKTYKTGTIVRHEGALFKFTSDHEPGIWDLGEVKSWSINAESQEKLSELGSEVGFLEAAINITEVSFEVANNNAYIGIGGSVASGGSSSYTKPIMLKAGEKIVVTCKGYLTNISIISEVVSEDNRYTPLVISIDSNIRNYSYVNESNKDMSIALSYVNAGGIEVKKKLSDNIVDSNFIKSSKNPIRIVKKTENVNGIFSISGFASDDKITEWKTTDLRLSIGYYASNKNLYLRAKKTNEVPVLVELSLPFSEQPKGINEVIFGSIENGVVVHAVIDCDIITSLSDIGIELRFQPMDNIKNSPLSAVFKIESHQQKIEFFESALNLEEVSVEAANNNAYIATNGVVSSGGSASYTKPVLLESGATIFATCKGYLTNISIISEFVNESSRYVPLVKSVDSNIRNYSYTNTSRKAMNVSFSYVNAGGIVVKKTKVSPSASFDKSFDGIIDFPLMEPIHENADMLQLVKDWGFIGDSLSSGVIYYQKKDGETIIVSDYEYSWGQNICKQCGTKGTNFSIGGLTAKTWLSRYWGTTQGGYKTGGTEETFNDNPKKVYTICLGTNEAHTQFPIGAWSDVDMNDYNNNLDTYYGNYAGIIQRIKSISPSSKIFVLTLPKIFRADADSYGINGAIKEIASKFDNVFLVDLAKYCPYSNEIKEKYQNTGHLTAAGYVWVSYVIGNIINYVIRTNLSAFNSLPFMLTNKDDGTL